MSADLRFTPSVTRLTRRIIRKYRTSGMSDGFVAYLRERFRQGPRWTVEQPVAARFPTVELVYWRPPAAASPDVPVVLPRRSELPGLQGDSPGRRAPQAGSVMGYDPVRRQPDPAPAGDRPNGRSDDPVVGRSSLIRRLVPRVRPHEPLVRRLEPVIRPHSPAAGTGPPEPDGQARHDAPDRVRRFERRHAVEPDAHRGDQPEDAARAAGPRQDPARPTGSQPSDRLATEPGLPPASHPGAGAVDMPHPRRAGGRVTQSGRLGNGPARPPAATAGHVRAGGSPPGSRFPGREAGHRSDAVARAVAGTGDRTAPANEVGSGDAADAASGYGPDLPGQSESDRASPANGIDLQKLADRVYRLISERLRRERDTRGR